MSSLEPRGDPSGHKSPLEWPTQGFRSKQSLLNAIYGLVHDLFSRTRL